MSKELAANQVRFWDANKVPWIYDYTLERVYAEGTLEDDPQSGYYAGTLDEAIQLLNEYGYMEADK